MKKEIENEFNEAVEIRQELNNVHWKDYNNLSKVFANLFGEEGNLLKKLSDLNYYQGGYPSESTPARIETMFKNAGKVVQYYDAMGRLDELNIYFAEFGFKIEAIGSYEMIKMDSSTLNKDAKSSKALKAVQDRFDFKVLDNAEEMLTWFLDKTKTLQGIICARADEIKIDIYDRVSMINGDIDKGGFVGAVNHFAAKKTKLEAGKDAENLVEKATEKANTLRANGDFLEEVIIND